MTQTAPDILLPRPVELAHHVVEKQNGAFPHRLLHKLALPQFQREHHAALLALRAKQTRAAPVDEQLHIVSVRPHHAHAALHLQRDSLRKLGFQRLAQRGKIGDERLLGRSAKGAILDKEGFPPV